MQRLWILTHKKKGLWIGRTSLVMRFYMDKGRSILLFFLLANLTCFVIFMHKSNSIVIDTKTKASRMCLKYKETAEKTRKARITSSHITNTTTSTLEEEKLEAVEEKNDTEAQSCLDRIWYSLSCSARFDRVIIFLVLRTIIICTFL